MPIDGGALTTDGLVLAVDGAHGFDADLAVREDGSWSYVSEIEAAGDRIALPPAVFTPVNTYSFVIHENGVYTRTQSFTIH